MRTRVTRHCCVRNCPNPPAKGRKTCGKHGQRRATKAGTTTRIHFDRVLNPTDLRAFHADATPGTVTLQPLPVEKQYMAGVAIRDNGAIVGLPTTVAGFKALLAEWLNWPGHSLADVEILTPSHMPRTDASLAICNAAARLVKHDIGLGGVA